MGVAVGVRVGLGVGVPLGRDGHLAKEAPEWLLLLLKKERLLLKGLVGKRMLKNKWVQHSTMIESF